MKKILILHTGGTIGSVALQTQREMNADSVRQAKTKLQTTFAQSASKFASCTDMFEDALFPEDQTTLSESMYMQKLMQIAQHLNTFSLDNYAGVILLHGTDTLAYTASLFSFLYADTNVPIILVSGNKPPDAKGTNAHINFKTAVELIWQGIAPNVYVTYKNSDGFVRLFLASSILQCPNYSTNFGSGSKQNVFRLKNSANKNMFELCQKDMFAKCVALSNNRNNYACQDIKNITSLSSNVMLLYPYTGLNYLVYSAYLDSAKNNCFGVVHGTYHSGTVCLPGLVCLKKLQEAQNNPLPNAEAQNAKIAMLTAQADQEIKSQFSILHLAQKCEEKQIPLYIAPSKLGKDQYETMAVVSQKSNVTLLNMTTESAYAKLVVGLSAGLKDKNLYTFMQTNVCNEMLD